MRYGNGLDLYVNGSRVNWAIKGHESSRFVELSALVNGQRIDRIHRSVVISDACEAIEGMKPVRIAGWSGLKAISSRKYSVTLPLRFPKSLKTGSNVWVKVSIIDLRNNLYRPGDPDVSVALKSGNTGIEITGFERKGRTVEIRPPSKTEQVSDTVVVQTREKERVATSEFRIQALVEYPFVWRARGDESYSWGYAFRGGDEMSGNSDTGASFYFADIACGGVSKPGIFSHPPYRNGVGYTYGILGPVVIPDDDCEFRAFIGLKDGGDTSDGVVFQVLALDESGREHLLVRDLWDKREWKAISASLSAFSGRKIRLKLIADVGPDSSSTSDWASWGEPRIVETTAVMRIEVGR